MDSDEHVQVFHVYGGLLGSVDRPIRLDDSRGKSRHFDGFHFLLTIPSCSSCALKHQNPQSIVSRLGGTVEVDPTPHSTFGEKNVSSFSKYV